MLLCSVGAETTTGCLLAASALGKRDVSPHDVGTRATEDLLHDLSYHACVDQHLQDQVRSCRLRSAQTELFIFSAHPSDGTG